MARQSEQGNLEMPDFRRVMSKFKQDTYEQILHGFSVQHIPLTPQERISKREPTGRGIREMDLRTFGNDPNEAGFIFTIPEHMRWAEMGVMRGLPSSRVQRGRKPNFKRRYANPFNPLIGNTFRPTFSQELAHLSRRYGTFLRDFYGEQMVARMFDALGGEIEDVDIGL